MYQIITAPHTTLKKEAKSIKRFDKKLQNIIEEMQKTLDATRDPEGVGLAAPQVNLSI
ncbi:MAG: peptide deformylase, partial [Candidatus Levybacteria bacterium]|nr:peptide deformylase [Candidatus Levybacteria bacterium]